MCLLLFTTMTDSSIINFFQSKIQYYFYLIAIPMVAIFLFLFVKYFPFGDRTHIFVLILFTIVPRTLWLLAISVSPQKDSLLYHHYAYVLSQNMGLTSAADYISVFPHTAGFPIVLSLLYRWFGSDLLIPQILNIALDVVSVILLYYIVRVFHRNRIAFGAGMLYALWPSQIIYTGLIYTEKLFFVFMLCSIFTFLQWYTSKQKHLYALILTGIFASLAGLTRPLGLLLMVSFFVAILIAPSFSIKKKILQFVPLVVSFFVITFACQWLLQSYIQKPIAKLPFGYNLYVGFNKVYQGAWNPSDAAELSQIIKQKDDSAQEIHDIFFAKAQQRFTEYSFTEVLQLFGSKFKLMWSHDDESIQYTREKYEKTSGNAFDFYRYERLFIKVSNLYYFSIILLSFLAMWLPLHKKAIMSLFPLLLLYIGTTILHLFVESAPRYHLPAIPLFCIFAAQCFVAKKTSLSFQKDLQ